MPDVEPYPAMEYSWPWLVVALGVIVVIVAWYLLLPILARFRLRKPQLAPVPQIPPLTGLAPARRTALARISAVEKGVAAKTLPIREAHLELSAILREFAFAVTGVDARVMTLAELKASNFHSIADVVAQYYPIAFQVTEHTALGNSAELARRVVESWR